MMATTHNENKKIAQLRADNDGVLPSYAWPGGYPLFYIDSDGNMLCPHCANENDEYSAMLIDYDVNYEDESLFCDNSGVSGCEGQIHSAYGDDND